MLLVYIAIIADVFILIDDWQDIKPIEMFYNEHGLTIIMI